MKPQDYLEAARVPRSLLPQEFGLWSIERLVAGGQLTSPTERIDGLKRMHARGIFTWVSLEPTLDVEASLAIIRAIHGFVDLYKIGKANYLKEITHTTDWRDYTLRVIDLCQAIGARHYIKRSLQEWLPPGYENPLRVPQHH